MILLVALVAVASPPSPPLKCAPGALAAGTFIRVANTTLMDAVAFCAGNISCGGFTVNTKNFSNGGKDVCATSSTTDKGIHLFYFKSDVIDGNGDPTWHTWSKPGYTRPLYACANGKCIMCPQGSGACARETYVY